jgi:large subunit ribosomal protein L29
MKAIEVHKLSGEEIDVELDRLRRKLYDLRCQAATEKIEDPSLFKKVRADIARLLTERTVRLHKASGGAPKTAPRRATKAAALAVVKKKTTTRKTTAKKGDA